MPTLSAHNFSHMFRAGDGDTFGHVLRFLRPDLIETHAGQGVHEGAEVRGTVGLRNTAKGLRQPQHGQLEGELVGPVVPYAVGAVQFREQARCRHFHCFEKTRLAQFVVIMKKPT